MMTGMDLGLTGRRCLVTGASRGIGRATALALHAEGAHVLMVAREEAGLIAVAEEGEAARSERHGSLDYLALDLVEPDAAQRAVSCCVEQLGGIDVLVNNAGTSFARPLAELTDADWQGQWDLHVMAPMRLMRAASPRMAQAGWGRMVNVCSSSGKRPSQRNVAYSVTKSAQLALSRAFADSLAAQNVLVNAVAPGPVATGLWTGVGGLADQVAHAQGTSREEALAAVQRSVPLGRLAEPDEVAAVIVFLCSQAASTVTGAAWSADGGAVGVII